MNSLEVISRFAESIADPLLIVDAELKIAAANAAAREMLGGERKSLIERSIAEFVDEVPASFSEKVSRWMRNGSGLPAAIQFKTATGRSFRTHCTGSVQTVGDRRFVVLHCRTRAESVHRFVALNEKIEQLAREIAERTRAETALRESESRFRSLFEQASDAIVITDQSGAIIDANPAASELVGRPLEELRRLTPLDLAPPEHRAWAEELVREFEASGAQRGSYMIRRPDGEVRHIEYSAVHDFIPGRSLAIIRDVTERRRIEAERDRKTAELARSNAELERFAFIASHDLQEPLRTMHSFAQLLERQLHPNGDETVRECLHFIVDGSLRMRRIILDLLEFSRLGQAAVNIREVSMTTVLETVVENLATSIYDSGATVEMNELPVIAADETEMVQLFQNLIANALKFRGVASPRIRVYAAVSDGECTFSVTDNGPGIAPEYCETIFEAFKRLHGREVPGTGIGLAVCRRIVENHSGRIWVESAPGGGATFRVALPHRQKAPTHRPGTNPLPARNQSPIV